MTRAIALVPILVLAGLPVLIRPSSGHAAAALGAVALGAAGVLAGWRPLVTAGGSLTLIQYTLALTGRRASLASAVVLGVSLALVLDVSEFAGRLHGAAPGATVLGRQARHWLTSAILGALATTTLGVLAALVRFGGPPALPPLLAALGALAAVVGVAGAVWRRRPDDG
jgi:hypothetical protein